MTCISLISTYWFHSDGFNFDFLSTSLEIGWEERLVSDMTYLVLSETLNLNSID